MEARTCWVAGGVYTRARKYPAYGRVSSFCLSFRFVLVALIFRLVSALYSYSGGLPRVAPFSNFLGASAFLLSKMCVTSTRVGVGILERLATLEVL